MTSSSTGFTKIKSYRCSRHGDQGGFVGVEIQLSGLDGNDLPNSLQPRARRRYCMACWIDMMDEFLCPLEEVE